jgi:tyrosyl-tRNA synthetase
VPHDIPTISIKDSVSPIELADLLVETSMVPSKSEARRMIEQNAVRIDKEIVSDKKTMINLQPDMLIQVGKRKFIKVTE